MSKLDLSSKVGPDYDRSVLAEIVRTICNQVNPLSEGKISARYQAQVSVPVSVAAAVGDVVWDSNVTVTNGTARLGWVCNVASQSSATWQEIRVLVSNAVGVLGSEQASTSGTSIDFTSIPSYAKRIDVLLVGVSTNGSSNVLIQIGDSGGVETSGYLGASSALDTVVSSANSTSGFVINNGGASIVRHGKVSICLEDGSDNTWVASGGWARSDGAGTGTVFGSKALSATLDRVRITTANGTDAFDAGAINVIYM